MAALVDRKRNRQKLNEAKLCQVFLELLPGELARVSGSDYLRWQVK
jgi:hypothetical protein